MPTLNPYETPVVDDTPFVRTWAIPFAVSATIAFVLTAIASTGNDLSVYFGTPTAFVRNVFPAFVFAFLVGWLCAPHAARERETPLFARLLGGCILGVSAIPANWLVLHLFPWSNKIVEIAGALLIPVTICTLVERLFLMLHPNEQRTKGG